MVVCPANGNSHRHHKLLVVRVVSTSLDGVKVDLHHAKLSLTRQSWMLTHKQGKQPQEIGAQSLWQYMQHASDTK